MDDPACVHLSLRLRDRFIDHGLVSVLIAIQHGRVMEIDTWLMSCRVIGRTVEHELLNQLVRRARAAGCEQIRGVYLPTAKNAMVADLFNGLGFRLMGESDGATEWRYDLPSTASTRRGFIEVIDGAA